MDEWITSCEKYSLRIIDIKGLKIWATRNLFASSHLRAVLILEKDKLTVDEFLAKMGTWLMITQLDESQPNQGASSMGAHGNRSKVP